MRIYIIIQFDYDDTERHEIVLYSLRNMEVRSHPFVDLRGTYWMIRRTIC